jgi:hypothetical protein
MSEIITPEQLSESVKFGFERLKHYRRARAMFIKEYCGQYLRDDMGVEGEEPINLIYNAVRVIVPNLVMKNPENDVGTDYIQFTQSADELALKLNSVQEQIKFHRTLRSWIVDALFGFGILKVALKRSNHLFTIDDINVDLGQVYAERVDLDDFVFDPSSRSTDFTDASFVGNRVEVPRQYLLDMDGFNHDLVATLPRSDEIKEQNTARIITAKKNQIDHMRSLRDTVSIVDLWIPESGKLITIADPNTTTTDEYLRDVDYEGPEDGPYEFLSFSQPVPDNPLPVAPVGVWYDIHRAANRIFKKLVDQADSQKNILIYNPANADEAQEIVDAYNNDSVASADPNAFNVVQFGGPAQDNYQMTSVLQGWFSLMSGNTDQLGGAGGGDADTATEAQILQANSSISIEDAKQILYDRVGDVSKRMAYYLWTDPIEGGASKEDFLEFTFKIHPKSMARLDPMVRLKRILDFTNLLPAAVQSAQLAMQSGVPFDLAKYLMGVAEELDIADWVQEVFNDPQYIQKMQILYAMGPANPGKQQMSTEGVQQNNGLPTQRAVASPQEMQNAVPQETAAIGQATMQGIQ